MDIQALSTVFQSFPDILAVYLFGSTASGKTHRESDIDLAIVPRNSQVRERKLDILTALARHRLCNVDLVILDQDDIVLHFEAVHQNQVIYAAADFDRGTYYSKVVRRYLDFLPYLEVQRQAYKRTLLHGQE